MSRLIISKTDGGTLFTIKNIGSLELSGAKTILTTSLGTVESSIFVKNKWGLHFRKFWIVSGGSYHVYQDRECITCVVNYRVQEEIERVLKEHLDNLTLSELNYENEKFGVRVLESLDIEVSFKDIPKVVIDSFTDISTNSLDTFVGHKNVILFRSPNFFFEDEAITYYSSTHLELASILSFFIKHVNNRQPTSITISE